MLILSSTGSMEAAIGRATNNPVMEQKGWERKVSY
jgi:hypothetical protein